MRVCDCGKKYPANEEKCSCGDEAWEVNVCSCGETTFNGEDNYCAACFYRHLGFSFPAFMIREENADVAFRYFFGIEKPTALPIHFENDGFEPIAVVANLYLQYCASLKEKFQDEELADWCEFFNRSNESYEEDYRWRFEDFCKKGGK